MSRHLGERLGGIVAELLASVDAYSTRLLKRSRISFWATIAGGTVLGVRALVELLTSQSLPWRAFVAFALVVYSAVITVMLRARLQPTGKVEWVDKLVASRAARSKLQVADRMRGAAREYLAAGEQVRVLVPVIVVNPLLVRISRSSLVFIVLAVLSLGMFGLLLAPHYAVLTTNRLILIRATMRWRRAKRLAFSDERGSVTTSGNPYASWIPVEGPWDGLVLHRRRGANVHLNPAPHWEEEARSLIDELNR